jgi:hypothetical protein
VESSQRASKSRGFLAFASLPGGRGGVRREAGDRDGVEVDLAGRAADRLLARAAPGEPAGSSGRSARTVAKGGRALSVLTVCHRCVRSTLLPMCPVRTAYSSSVPDVGTREGGATSGDVAARWLRTAIFPGSDWSCTDQFRAWATRTCRTPGRLRSDGVMAGRAASATWLGAGGAVPSLLGCSSGPAGLDSRPVWFTPSEATAAELRDQFLLVVKFRPPPEAWIDPDLSMAWVDYVLSHIRQ